MELDFPALLGQEKAKKIFGRSLGSGRIAHAYLLQGPDGVGKQLFARSVATYLNCLQPMEDGGCGVCTSCRKLSSGNHPDFLLIQPERGTIKIDQIRELKKAVSFPPYESKMRVVLLEDIHTMRREAANSLLKVLEEPPEANLLLLTAETSQEVLQTIISRCQTIPFHSLSLDDTEKILLEKDREMGKDSARMLARLSEGSPGKALLLHKTKILNTWENVTSLLSEKQGDEELGRLFKVAETMAELKENLLPLLGLLRIWVRDQLMQRIEEKRNDTAHRVKRDGGREEKVLETKALFGKLEAIDQAETEIGQNCNRTLVCEVLLFRLQ